MSHEFFAPVAKGLAGVLAEELRGLGAAEPRTAAAGVSFGGPLAIAYRACLWSRVASRVLLILTRAEAPDADGLYAAVRTVPWHDHLGPDDTLAVDFTGTSPNLTNTRYGALKVKDAIVDHLRDRYGRRPNIDTVRPSVRVNVHLEGETAVICLDLAGEPLHRRGYRATGVTAPLKETLAAAILRFAGWPAAGPLVDPMCGSGTLLIEGAMMAADIAPGLERSFHGFSGWRGHEPETWAALVAEARQRRVAGLRLATPTIGFDADAVAVTATRAGARRAGIPHLVQVEHRPLAGWTGAPPYATAGVVVTNPPYGHRLGESALLATLYRELGQVLTTHFAGWPAAVLVQDPELAGALGLPWQHQRRLFNGALPCLLCQVTVPCQPTSPTSGLSGPMFVNRLRKNQRTRSRWARRQGVTCYRLYDADMPEFALAVDLYHDDQGQPWAHVQEYHPPRSVDPARAAARREEALAAIDEVLALAPGHLVFKVRQRQRGPAQYCRQGHTGRQQLVHEGGLAFYINLTDYLDTGLFLDHRETRSLLRSLAAGKAFLNLFAYTGSATVYAAAGGAVSTTTVDLSPVYLEWAQRNLQVNGISGPHHHLVRADCRAWLAESRRDRYGLIFLDPPTFSNSKRMAGNLDLQRDHARLIGQAAALLEPDGILIFSSNYHRLALDLSALSGLDCTEITAQTVPSDFAGRSPAHRSWRITRKPRR